MKRLVLILLLAILPFQFAWSAVSSYCQHEEGKAAQHFGHHIHKHEKAADAAAKDVQDKSGKKAHSDCGYCHLASQAPLLNNIPDIASPTGVTHHDSLSLTYSSHIPEGPRRPDRVAVV